MRKVIAVNTGLNASAGYFENGHPVFCIQEERLVREKNFGGVPKDSLNYLLKNFVTAEELDAVVLTNAIPFVISKEAYYNYYNRLFEEGIQLSAENVKVKQLKEAVKKTSFYGLVEKMRSGKGKSLSDDVTWLSNVGIEESKISRIDHHVCHASAVYHGLATELDKNYLVFTLDGGGDGNTSTVSTGVNGKLTLRSNSDCYSIGNMYSAITYFLGFKPHEHEYKLMGLAPYVNVEYIKSYRDFFAQYLRVSEDGVFYNPEPMNHSIFFSKLIQTFRKDRFDNIAAGLQWFCEEIIEEWVTKNIAKYGIDNILCSGGVFMNVKSNKNLSTLKSVNSINVFPSCGDETNIFGAAFTDFNENGAAVGLLSTFNIGTVAETSVEEALKSYEHSIEIEKLTDVPNAVAEMLCNNLVVGRSSGSMEFGARALGNRSILANPSDLKNVGKINHAIKKRDFWMPFAPIVMEEDVEQYFKVPGSLQASKSPYMMFALDSVEPKRDKIICGLHQADFTGRVQTISDEMYPELHKILSSFKAKTGESVLLNTSFNLHGFPIVNDSYDAIEVLLNSAIDVLIIGKYAVRRK